MSDSKHTIYGSQVEREMLLQRIDVLEDALTRILNWAEAYPLDVFPEPDFQAVQAALQKAGISLAQVSASNMRHVIQGVGDIARAALGRQRATVSAEGISDE